MIAYKEDIIKNYVFNYLKNIEINKIEHHVCKKILEYIKNSPQYQIFLKCIIHKDVQIYTDKLTYLFNKNFYSSFIDPFSIQRKNDWENINFFWNTSIFKDTDKIFYVLIDVGNFKKINDNLSYKTGDYFLKVFAYFLIKENIEFIIRNGGDEFVLIVYSKEKVFSLLKKFKDISFIKNLNYNVYKMYLIIKKTMDTEEEKKLITNEHTIIYIGAGYQEINLNKIRKYIKNKNSKAYKQYINHIELSAAENMKKYKKNLQKNINIISYRD